MDDVQTSLKHESALVQSQASIPAFLLKLWRIVEDPQFDHMISWHQDGKTFRVHDQAEFAKEILPKYYKHNNFSSFVRQVNMYGFRKIVDPKTGGLKNEKDQWEFFHPHFSKATPDDLAKIKRKVHIKDEPKTMTTFIEDIERLKLQNDLVEEKFNIVKTENSLLWREISDLRERHKSQQAIINKLIQFFVNLVVGSGSQKLVKKRRSFDFLESSSSAKVPKSQVLQPYNPQNAAFQQLFQDVESFEQSSLEDTAPYTVTTPPEEDDQLLKIVSGASPAQVYMQPVTSDSVSNKVSLIQESSKPISSTVNILMPSSSSKSVNCSKPKTLSINQVLSGSCVAPKSIKIVPTAKQKPTLKPKKISAKKPKLEELVKQSSTALQTFPDSSDIKTEDCLDLSYLESINPDAVAVDTFSNISQVAPMITTPVIDVENEPIYTNHPTSLVKRLTSITDRDSITQDVDQISKSLDILQSMLDTNQLNLDLRNLQNAYNRLPTQVSLLDLIRMNQRQSEKEEPLEEEHDKQILEDQGQLLPYTVPFSPSQLIDEDYSADTSIQEDIQSNLLDDDCGF